MTGTLTRQDNRALFDLLASLADNKQALGRRYAYWCNGAPALEAAVAAAAMAQDELGHARTLYPLLSDFVQADADPGQVEPETRTLHYHISFLDHDFASWSDFVAANFLFDTALSTFFATAQHSTYEALRQRARKIVQEERVHAMYAESWLSRLARTEGAVRAGMIASLERLWDETLCWFGTPDDSTMQQLYQAEIIEATPDDLRRHYLDQVMPTLDRLEIDMPASFDASSASWRVERAFPWKAWNPLSRRLELTR